MLRTAVSAVACAAIALGVWLCTQRHCAPGGIQLLVGGAIVLIGTLFERWRYRNRNATSRGNWQATGERFIDPETGREVEVLYDPDSGERRYREVE